MNKRLMIVGFAVSVLLLAACGDDDGSATADPTADESSTASDSDADDPTDATDDGDPTENPAGDFVEDLTEDLEDAQAAQGGGTATFTVGDQTWTFASVLCAIGEDQTGQEGAEFNLSSIQDGLQMYVSIDQFGHSISLDDIKDFENPSVSLSSTGDGFLALDGKTISGAAEFRDGTTDDFTNTTTGTFTGTCP